MSGPLQDQIAGAMQSLQEYQQKLRTTQESLLRITESVASKDRSVAVVVGSQGDLRDITFVGDHYRELAPAELAALLVELVTKARAKMSERVATAFDEFAGMGTAMRASMTGGSTFDDVVSRMGSMMKDLPAGFDRHFGAEEQDG